MKRLAIGILLTFPAFLLTQAPATAGDAAPPDPQPDSAAPSPAPATTAATAFTPLTPGQKVKRRAFRLVEPVTLLGSAFGAGIDQLADVPHQWGQGMEGYAIRLASAEGVTMAHNGIGLGFDLAFHLDPRYRRMPEGTVKERLWNAVSQTFIANKDSGGRTINVSEIAGNFGAGFIANTWEPQGHNSTGDALTRGATGIAFHTLKNVAREFFPNIMHPGRSVSSPGTN